jgi:YHS domain-containing protein
MNTKKMMIFVVGMVLAYGVMTEGKAAKSCCGSSVKKAKLQTTCPVMGGKINKKLYVDVKGKRIYVCCAGCIAAIKKDPAKYISKLEKAGVTIEKVKPAKATVKK